MQRLYFIASYPRSGNTWVRSVIYELLRRQGAFDAPANDLRPMDIHVPSDVTPVFYERVTGKPAREITPSIAAAARVGVHRMLAETARHPLYVKTHAAYGLFGRSPTINTAVTRGAVYLVRNPLDVAASLAKFLGVDLREIVRVMQNDSAAQTYGKGAIWDPWSSWSTNVQSWMGARDFPVLVVRYEDLSADPGLWMGRIATHSGLEVTATEVEAVTSTLTLDRMTAMAETGALKVPIANADAVFVGSQRAPRSPAEDAILEPLRGHAAGLMRQLRYL